MRVDYHFHPNLLSKNPERRLRALWRSIEHHQLDAMICTEHSYKNAPEAYRRVIAVKPAHARTHIFPGAELVTKEGKGIDIIAFAEHDWYDDHPILLQPFALSLEEMIAYLKQSDLHYFIPHPYLTANPLKKVFSSTEKMKNFLASVAGYEICNGCYLQLEKFLCMFPLNYFFKNLCRELHESAQPLAKQLPESPRQFLAVGSDAHHPRELGVCIDIPCEKPSDRHCVFQTLIHNKTPATIHRHTHPFSLIRLLYMTWTAYSEGWMKKEWKRYDYHHTVFNLSQNAMTFTNK